MSWQILQIFALISLASAARKVTVGYAYVWVGGENGGADYIATIDWNPTSETYGNITAQSFVPPGPTRAINGNEAHHMSITPDRSRIVATGMHASLQGNDDIFVFTIEDAIPQFETSLRIPGYGCADSPLPVGDGTFMITMLCNSVGDAPGAIVLFDPATKNFTIWNQPSLPHDLGFNPHAGEYVPEIGLVVANYMVPLTMDDPVPTLRQTLSFFNPDGGVNASISLSGISAGPLGFNFIPNTTIGITQSGYGDNVLYVVDVGAGTAQPILNLSATFGTATSVPSAFFTSDLSGTPGTRFIFTFQMRYVMIVGFDPVTYKADLLYAFDFCNPPSGYDVPDQNCTGNGNQPGTHFMRFDPRTNKIIVTNYYIEKYPGTRSIHAFSLSKNRDSLSYDTAFRPIVDGSPHGIIVVYYTKSEMSNLFPSIYQTIILAYPLGVILLWLLWTIWVKLLDKKDPFTTPHDSIVIPPLFGWHSLVNSYEWRWVTFIQSLFICGGIIQAALQRSGQTPSQPLWAVAFQICFMIPCWLFGPAWSPIGWLARVICIGFPVDPVPAQPKRFAAFLNVMMGVFIYCMWFGLYWVESPGAFPWVLVIFGVLLWIDSFIGFCPGCFVYAYLLAPYNLYLPQSLKSYNRIKGEDEYYGIYYRWIPHMYRGKFMTNGGAPATSGASTKWRTKCENGICRVEVLEA